MQSRLAIAYTYSRQELYHRAVVLYAELAEAAVNSFLISRDSPVIEPVRINNGSEENKEALRKSRGEEDEDFQNLEYQAQKGNAVAMYKIGVLYYFGLRGDRRDHAKALSWFLKAVDKGEPRSMELLGVEWIKNVLMEEGNTTILTLFVCLLTVLYICERQRRQAVAAHHPNPPRQPNDNILN